MIKSQITKFKSQTNAKFEFSRFQISRFAPLVIGLLYIVYNLFIVYCDFNLAYAQDIKNPNVAGSFYPGDADELSRMIDRFLDAATPESIAGEIFGLISPHAGYEFSGQVAAHGYKLIRGRPYKTVVIIAPSHFYGFKGASVYPQGMFLTPLGGLKVDKEFAQKLLYKDANIFFVPQAFEEEHSLEVQLPFLQKALADFTIVPIIIGDFSFSDCRKLSGLLKDAIGRRNDVLVIASTDMYHGNDYQEAEVIDNLTLSYLGSGDVEGLYEGLADGKLQLCGGIPTVILLMLSADLGHKNIKVLKHTNSAEVTGKKVKGPWTVGYASLAIDQEKEESRMLLNVEQQKRLLEIARSSIETYLKTGKKMDVSESDPALLEEMGAFVTLHKQGELRGCIGNLTSTQALYLTVRDMAIEAAVDDPRFPPVEPRELKDIDIEISALSSLEKVDSAGEIKLGTHGVMIRKGFRSGVFLPQVAVETGWSKEEFLENLCVHKAGLPADCWKDKDAEIYIFTAEIFSEK